MHTFVMLLGFAVAWLSVGFVCTVIHAVFDKHLPPELLVFGDNIDMGLLTILWPVQVILFVVWILILCFEPLGRCAVATGRWIAEKLC